MRHSQRRDDISCRRGSIARVMTAALIAVACSLPDDVGAQPDTVTERLNVYDARPVARAIELLISRYPVVITCEDPRYEFQGDLLNRQQEVGARSPLLVPIEGSLALEYQASEEPEMPKDLRELLPEIVLQHELRNARGGRFRIEEDSDAFHVIPYAAKDPDGAWQSQESVLDLLITLDREEQVAGAEMLDRIVAAISEASGTEVRVGTIPLGAFFRFEGTLEARNERARDVLMRTLRAVDERLTWRLLFNPSRQRYSLNGRQVAGGSE